MRLKYFIAFSKIYLNADNFITNSGILYYSYIIYVYLIYWGEGCI